MTEFNIFNKNNWFLNMLEITIYDAFVLNKVLHKLIEQQSSYNIQTAFKIYNLIKWLDETERFVFERMNLIFGTTSIDASNSMQAAFLSSMIPFTETNLTIDELLKTDGEVKLEVNDIEILDKMLKKTEE